MKFIKKIFRWINLLVVGGTIIAFLAPYISPTVLWPISFFGLALPVFLLLNIVFLFLFFLLKERKGWYLNALCLGISMLFIGKIIGTGGSITPTNNTLKVLSFNSSGFFDFKGNVKKDMEPYQNIFKDKSIVCLQEANYLTNKQKYFDYFSETFGFSYAYGGKTGLKILSTYPIINKGILIGKATAANGCIYADIKLDTTIVRIYNYHLQSTGIAPEAQKVIDNPDLEDANTKKSVKNIAIRLKNGSIKRAKNVQVIKEHMDNCPYPIIACGDLNDTPFTYSYHKLKRGLKDSFVERGSGLGATYNGPIPFLRIDYILTSPSFNIYSHQLIDTELSDHYPIISEIGF